MMIQFKYAHFKCSRLVGGVNVSSVAILQLANSVFERLSTVLPILILNKRLVDLHTSGQIMLKCICKQNLIYNVNIPRVSRGMSIYTTLTNFSTNYLMMYRSTLM